LSKVIIGLTGPTGAGKSTVAKEFKKLGCAVIDADSVARIAVTKEKCLSELKSEFGNDIVGKDGILNRRLLAQRAFSSEKSSMRLNEITHPVIVKLVSKQIDYYKNSDAKAIIIDAALLFESGADAICDTVIAVTAPLDIRIQRIINRDSITPEFAKARIGAQHENSYYTQKSQYCFEGSIPLKDIPYKLRRLLEKIIGEFA
jgi:dephospho-CoA kinase